MHIVKVCSNTFCSSKVLVFLLRGPGPNEKKPLVIAGDKKHYVCVH